MRILKFNESVDSPLIEFTWDYYGDIKRFGPSIEPTKAEIDKINNLFSSVIGKTNTRKNRINSTNPFADYGFISHTISQNILYPRLKFLKFNDSWWIISIRMNRNTSAMDYSFICDDFDGLILLSKILKGEEKWGKNTKGDDPLLGEYYKHPVRLEWPEENRDE